MDIKRRMFFERAGLGSVALLSLPVLTGAKSPSSKEGQEKEHRHDNVSGPLASATVSFGQWSAAPLDRFPNLGAPGLPNQHTLVPHISLIKAGGSVNFIIAGFHHILVYGGGTKPEDIDQTNTVPPTNGGPPLIADPTNRVYRGLDPSTVLGVAPGATPGSLVPAVIQDRVEVVQFPEKGLYLVICGVLPHFLDDMYGWVKVV